MERGFSAGVEAEVVVTMVASWKRMSCPTDLRRV